MPDIIVREAKPEEQVKMAKVAAAAFFNDEMFGGLIHPHRDQYPDDTYLYWLKRIHKCWNDPNSHFLVSVLPNENGKADEIAAWAQWVRKGAAASYKSQLEDLKDLPKLPPNRAADPEFEGCLEGSYKSIAHQWSGQRAECWDIAWLATSPSHQGEGHGKALMQWGMSRGVEEGVALSVIAAVGMDGFYNKLGYTVPSGRACDGIDNPLSGRIVGGHFWWNEAHLQPSIEDTAL